MSKPPRKMMTTFPPVRKRDPAMTYPAQTMVEMEVKLSLRKQENDSLLREVDSLKMGRELDAAIIAEQRLAIERLRAQLGLTQPMPRVQAHDS